MNGSGVVGIRSRRRSPADHRQSRSTKASPAGPSVTISRRAQLHRCPAVMKADCTVRQAAASRSAQSWTTSGLFPPISSASIFSGWSASARLSARRRRQLPVKKTPSMSGVARPSRVAVCRPALHDVEHARPARRAASATPRP